MRDEATRLIREALAGSERVESLPARKAWQTPLVIVGSVSVDSEVGPGTHSDNNAAS